MMFKLPKFLKKEAKLVPFSAAMRLSPNVIAHYPDYRTSMVVNRYIDTDQLYSIVRYLATTAALIPIYEYDEKGEEVPDSIINNMSMIRSKFEILEATYSNLFLHGEAFLAVERSLSTGNAIDFKPLDPMRVVIHSSVYEITKYEYLISASNKIEYDPVNVVHIKNFNPEDENRGLSPVRILLKALHLLSTTDGIKQAQMQNGGLDSIVFEKTFDNLDNGKSITESRRANFMKFITNPSNKGMPYFAQGDMGAISVGNTLADMQVMESEKITFKRLCNVYGTSDILFNSDAASTESNVREMIKRTYTNSILPNVGRVVDALKMKLKLNLKYDISEIPELQQDMSNLINSLNTAYWLTPNQKLEAMRYGRSDNPLFDSYFIPVGVRPIDDLQMLDDETEGL